MLEALEDRFVPTSIPFNGGPIIPHVQVNNIVTGSQPIDTSAFMQAMVKDYLPLLGPYYGIGAGSLRSAVTANPLPGTTPSDDQFHNLILQEINSGAVPKPDGNQLYFVFLAPGQSVSSGVLLGIHSAFLVIPGPNGYQILHPGMFFDPGVTPLPVYYAVSDSGPANLVTVTASHELASAVTDPDGMSGYIDLGSGLENADVYESSNPAVLDGYQVAVISGPQGQMIGTPLAAPTPLLHTPYLLGLFDAFFHGAALSAIE
jgi:hypothetical protein